MQRIIEAQGGNPKIKPEDLKEGEYKVDYAAEKNGTIDSVSCSAIAKLARAAGAPATPEAGIVLNKRYGDKVRQGEKIFTVYSRSERNINMVLQLMNEQVPVIIK
jgi:AMP phosphorylase